MNPKRLLDDELDAKIEAANALPLDDPGRCAVYQEIEQDFVDRIYIIPMTQSNTHFIVQPWLLGFEASGNIDFATLPFMKLVAR